MGWLSGLIGAVTSVAGINAGKRADKTARTQAERDRQLQLEMAKNQIQWRVADAKAAGLHPLYALGATPMSYSPVSVSGGNEAAAWANNGQDLSRALTAMMGPRERRAELLRAEAERAIQREREGVRFQLEVERGNLQNQLLASQIAKLNAPGTGPGVDINNAPPGSVSVVPARNTASLHGNTGGEAGGIRDFGYARTADGGLAIVPSYDVHERIEDNIFLQAPWAFRNQLLPNFAPGSHTPDNRDYPLPPGQQWEWDFMRQAFYPQDIRTGRWIRSN